jgi:hypothetical protein
MLIGGTEYAGDISWQEFCEGLKLLGEALQPWGEVAGNLVKASLI